MIGRMVRKLHAASWICLLICFHCGAAEVEQLSKLQDRFIEAQQDWGVLGINTCAHAAGVKPIGLRIGDQEFAHGLGTHANGFIEIALDGEFERFDAQVGVQSGLSAPGSVVFEVFVDGKKRFDSGTLRGGEAAKAVSVDLHGAQAMRLVARAATDSINCDCANWAQAILTRLPGATRKVEEQFDVAPFGQLMTSDPKRMDGARAGRTQEYHADDFYLEWPIESADTNVACIGLNWLERRPIREIGVVFKSDAPPPAGATAQMWVGQTVFQGQWKQLTETIQKNGRQWQMKIDGQAAFQKVRWILPRTAREMGIDHLTAAVQVPMARADFVIETDKGKPSPESVSIYNGQLISKEPSRLSLRYAQTRRDKADQTLLRFVMPDGRGFSVAVDDVLKRGPVLVRDYGVYIADASKHISLDEYKNRIAGRHTVLQEVESRPDQRLAATMAKLHHAVQDTAPVMLSLSCDNHKVIVERAGNIGVVIDPLKPDATFVTPPKNVHPIEVKFGNGSNANLSRHLAGGWLPAPVIQVDDNGAHYQEEVMVVPETAGPVAICDFALHGGKSPATLSLSFPDATFRDSPDGKIAEAGGKLFALVTASHAAVKASGHQIDIIGGDGTARVLIPFWAADANELAGKFADPLAELRKYWQGILDQAMQVDVPDELLMSVIRASQVNCLMAARTEPGTNHIEPWIASVSYGPLESESHSIIRGMDLMGHADFARRSLEYFISKYDPSGMLTTGYTLMGTGWHLQTLGQHYALCHDQDWLRSMSDKVATACRWIDRQRKKSLDGPSGIETEPQYGLAPPGVMADWGNYAFYFCLNGYYCAGLRDASAALADIGVPGARELLKASEEYARAIRRAYAMTQALTPVYPLRDGTWVPGYPSQIGTPGPTNNFFPGEDGNRSWCYDIELGAHQLVPQGVLDASSRDVDWMMNHMEDVQFLANGWFDYPAAQNEADPFDFGGFAKVQPYYCRNAEIYAMRNDVKPFIRSYFNTLPTLLNSEVLTIEEHFRRIGAWNKTHETGYFLSQTRYMLVMEHGDSLWLAPLVTSNWFGDGKAISVKNAPTRFGLVCYRIVSSASKGFIDVSVDRPSRKIPQDIVIRVRDPQGRKLKRVQLDGRPYHDFDPVGETITIHQPGSELHVRAWYQ